jgi:hypothetical protein
MMTMCVCYRLDTDRFRGAPAPAASAREYDPRYERPALPPSFPPSSLSAADLVAQYAAAGAAAALQAAASQAAAPTSTAYSHGHQAYSPRHPALDERSAFPPLPTPVARERDPRDSLPYAHTPSLQSPQYEYESTGRASHYGSNTPQDAQRFDPRGQTDRDRPRDPRAPPAPLVTQPQHPSMDRDVHGRSDPRLQHPSSLASSPPAHLRPDISMSPSLAYTSTVASAAHRYAAGALTAPAPQSTPQAPRTPVAPAVPLKPMGVPVRPAAARPAGTPASTAPYRPY